MTIFFYVNVQKMQLVLQILDLDFFGPHIVPQIHEPLNKELDSSQLLGTASIFFLDGLDGFIASISPIRGNCKLQQRVGICPTWPQHVIRQKPTYDNMHAKACQVFRCLKTHSSGTPSHNGNPSILLGQDCVGGERTT